MQRRQFDGRGRFGRDALCHEAAALRVAAGMMRTKRRRNAEAGFTLLEAIVAIVVLLATLVPLYALVSSVSRSAFRVDEANRRAEFETDALNIMATVNPMETPNGALDLGPYAV